METKTERCVRKVTAKINRPTGGKHTPGPWHVEAAGRDKWKIFAGDEYIGVIVSCVKPDCRFDADALLVAAAPDLLAACKLMYQAWEQLLPNLKTGVVQNYGLVLTTAPVACGRAIAAATGKG